MLKLNQQLKRVEISNFETPALRSVLMKSCNTSLVRNLTVILSYKLGNSKKLKKFMNESINLDLSSLL